MSRCVLFGEHSPAERVLAVQCWASGAIAEE